MTLRARLTLVLMILVAVGLIVADVATFAALRSFLVRRGEHRRGVLQALPPRVEARGVAGQRCRRVGIAGLVVVDHAAAGRFH